MEKKDESLEEMREAIGSHQYNNHYCGQTFEGFNKDQKA